MRVSNASPGFVSIEAGADFDQDVGAHEFEDL
jgi:hypothetical protein